MNDNTRKRIGWLTTRVRLDPYFRGGDFRNAEATLILGDCLRPWFLNDDVVWVDRNVVPKDGEIVMVRMTYEATRPGGMLGGAGSRYEKQLAVKQLKIVEGSKFLVCADGCVSAEPHEIAGTVIAWSRRRWWQRPAVRKMHFDLPVKVLDAAFGRSRKGS